MSVVTRPTVTAASTSATPARPSSTLSPGAIAGIVIGALLALVLLGALAFYLLRRHIRHKFVRVPNPRHDLPSRFTGAPHLSSDSIRREKHSTHHSQRPSQSSEPLISPVSWPPIPSTSRVHSPPDSVSPVARENRHSVGEVTQVTAAGTVRSAAPIVLKIPPVRKPDRSPSSPTSQQNFFIHRMLQSRALASEGFLSRLPSLDSAQGRFSTVDSAAPADEEHLLAEAEQTAIRDAEMAERDRERAVSGEDEWEDAASSESAYSQPSASVDHSPSFLSPASRESSTRSVRRQRSSRRRPRATELAPVAEVPDVSRVSEGRSGYPASTATNSSLDGQISHGTSSRPTSSLVDPPGAFPLLTSANFGKDSTTSGTPVGSVSSTVAWESHGSSRTSRYPSLAPSSIGRSTRSGPRSDDDTDWHHLPPGLSGLKKLQVGPLENPHSPVEEHPAVSLAADATEHTPAKQARAHLREGTTSSQPEVERREVMQGGIARIDVVL